MAWSGDSLPRQSVKKKTQTNFLIDHGANVHMDAPLYGGHKTIKQNLGYFGSDCQGFTCCRVERIEDFYVK
jgi:hypothetical protein